MQAVSATLIVIYITILKCFLNKIFITVPKFSGGKYKQFLNIIEYQERP